MNVVKSTRHSEIIGSFGESLVCNWLSRSGFEVVIVDHTGIDILAYNRSGDKRLGISVKSRTRNPGRERDAVNLLSYQKRKDDRKKMRQACKAFNCEPWIAVYVEASERADLYLTSLEHYDRKYRLGKGRAIDDWKMGPEYQKKYIRDRKIWHIQLTLDATNWPSGPTCS